MIKKGLFHGVGIVLIVMACTYVYGLYVSEDSTESLVYLTYMILVGSLGYKWKKKNGVTFSLVSREANNRIFWYSFGAVIPLVILMFISYFSKIIAIGSWWSLIFLILIPLALGAQALTFATVLTIGGWFCKK